MIDKKMYLKLMRFLSSTPKALSFLLLTVISSLPKINISHVHPKTESHTSRALSPPGVSHVFPRSRFNPRLDWRRKY